MATAHNQRDSSSSSPRSTYAFLNHSPDTVHNSLPPSVDDRPLVRQKRKRTSPEDQAVLEAAYKRDPKPDKAARLEIVEQVELGEKEVQIWFQNRRQCSRRRSRPLLPHEVAQYHLSRGDADNRANANFDSDTATSQHWDSSLDAVAELHAAPVDNEESQRPAGTILATSALSTAPTVCDPSSIQPHTTRFPDRPHAASLPTNALGRGDAIAPMSRIGEQQSRVTYLADRRNSSLAKHSFSEQDKVPVVVHADPARRIKKSSSFVRLSLNAEGKAEVVTKDAASPSPPRPHQTALEDAAGSILLAPSIPAPQALRRIPSNRSRDSRSWEFWCDKEARTELETTAEKDASGSAVGAIGLLRSTSGRSALAPVQAKQNKLTSGQPNSAKRSKLNHKRLPLQRASSSMGRLQSKAGQNMRRPLKLKQSGSAKSAHIKGSTSDKENWSPVSDAEQDDEVASFMRDGRQTTNPSGNDDLDCVQGLLSLSQGNWR